MGRLWATGCSCIPSCATQVETRDEEEEDAFDGPKAEALAWALCGVALAAPESFRDCGRVYDMENALLLLEEQLRCGRSGAPGMVYCRVPQPCCSAWPYLPAWSGQTQFAPCGTPRCRDEELGDAAAAMQPLRELLGRWRAGVRTGRRAGGAGRRGAACARKLTPRRSGQHIFTGAVRCRRSLRAVAP